VTLLWFVIWLIWNTIGDNEPLTFDPVNFWAGSLLFAGRDRPQRASRPALAA
jgi:hypothetical protein